MKLAMPLGFLRGGYFLSSLKLRTLETSSSGRSTVVLVESLVVSRSTLLLELIVVEVTSRGLVLFRRMLPRGLETLLLLS